MNLVGLNLACKMNLHKGWIEIDYVFAILLHEFLTNFSNQHLVDKLPLHHFPQLPFVQPKLSHRYKHCFGLNF